ncbi:MAG: hypothetical protein ABI806_17285 [Candidatus Solibacter sp.]
MNITVLGEQRFSSPIARTVSDSADIGYVHSIISAGIDWRKAPGYTRSGGLYEVTFHDYHQAGGAWIYSFQKLNAEIIQHLPLLRETWVLAGRARMETTLNDNRPIPYFMLPQLGSGDTLRAFATDRFRDHHSLLMNAEFRWMPALGWDMALFDDPGKVASCRGDLNFKPRRAIAA